MDQAQPNSSPAVDETPETEPVGEPVGEPEGEADEPKSADVASEEPTTPEDEDPIAKLVHDRGLRIVTILIPVPPQADGSTSEAVEVLALQPVK